MAKRGGRNALDVLADVVMGVLIVLLAAFVVGRYVFGARAFAVLTGSMTPALQVGDVVIDVPTAFEDIEVGDVVTYVINDDLDVATHRVVEVDEAQRTLLTKGDANASTDGTPVDYRNVVGVVRLSVPRLGYVLSFLSTTTGKIVGITVVIAVTVIFAIVHTLLGTDEDDREQRKRADGPVVGGATGGGEGPSAASGGDNSSGGEYDDFLDDADNCEDDEYDDYFDDDDDELFDDDDDWYDEDDEFDDGPSLPRGDAASGQVRL